MANQVRLSQVSHTDGQWSFLSAGTCNFGLLQRGHFVCSVHHCNCYCCCSSHTVEGNFGNGVPQVALPCWSLVNLRVVCRDNDLSCPAIQRLPLVNQRLVNLCSLRRLIRSFVGRDEGFQSEPFAVDKCHHHIPCTYDSTERGGSGAS